MVWDYENPFSRDIETTEQSEEPPRNAVYRAVRVPRDHPGLVGRNL
ncbi:MAG: hypothetical protein V3T77_09035 [Planctomycetota bacterium]